MRQKEASRVPLRVSLRNWLTAMRRKHSSEQMGYGGAGNMHLRTTYMWMVLKAIGLDEFVEEMS